MRLLATALREPYLILPRFKVANHGRVTTAMDENVSSSRVIGRQPALPVELISITPFTSYFRESP